MKQFQTSDKTTWNVSINIGTVKRLKAAGHDMMQLLGNGTPDCVPLLHSILTDELAAAEVLYQIIKPAADAHSIDEYKFLDMLDGPTAATARDAMLDEIEAFYTGLRRSEISEAVAATRLAVKEEFDKAAEKVKEVFNSTAASVA